MTPARDVQARHQALSEILPNLKVLHDRFRDWLPGFDQSQTAWGGPAGTFMMMERYLDSSVKSSSDSIRSVLDTWAPEESQRDIANRILMPERRLFEAYEALAPNGEWQFERAEWLTGQMLDMLASDQEEVRARFGFVGLEFPRGRHYELLETEITLDDELTIRVIGDGEAEEIEKLASNAKRRWYGSAERIVLEATLTTPRKLTPPSEHVVVRARALAAAVQGAVMASTPGCVYLTEIDHASTNVFGAWPRLVLLPDTTRPIPETGIKLTLDAIQYLRLSWPGIRAIAADNSHYLHPAFMAFVDGTRAERDTDAILSYVRGLETLLVDNRRWIGRQLTGRAVVVPGVDVSTARIDRLWKIRNEIAHGQLREPENWGTPEIRGLAETARECLRATWIWYFEQHRGASSASSGISDLDRMINKRRN